VGAGAAVVPIDPRLQEQEVLHVLRDSGARFVVAGASHYTMLRQIEEHLEDIVSVLMIDSRGVMPVEAGGLSYLDYAAALDAVSAPEETPRTGKSDDVASILYTSGTTGRQKGAMLTHANFLANVRSCRGVARVDDNDHFLLILPLHHAFAFTTSLLLPLASGAQISFVEHLRTIGENLHEVSPTILIGVPLLLEKMYGRMQSSVRAHRLGNLLYRVGLRRPIAQRIRARLGGRLRMIIVGGAPCPAPVLKGLGELGIPVAEGYGLTETAPVLTINPPQRPKPGSVGPALAGVELRILDPDEQGVGEIAARGASVMKGYFNQPRATEEVFRGGWFLTGDLGVMDEEGYLTIAGRKKSLIVNREGKNIYPEEVEQALIKSPLILEAVALGYSDSRDHGGERVGVLVVPDQSELDERAAREGSLSDDELRALVTQEVKRASRVLAEYKRPRLIRIRSEAFLRTSTGKIKRYLYSMADAEVG